MQPRSRRHYRLALVVVLLVVLLGLAGAGGGRATAVGPLVATEEIIAVSTFTIQRVPLRRTTSHLTMPPGATWETDVSSGSLILTVESNPLVVTLGDGLARVARAPDLLLGARTPRSLDSGAEPLLLAGDRLVTHQAHPVTVQNTGPTTAVATLVRVRRISPAPESFPR